jgi:hypothetical protein
MAWTDPKTWLPNLVLTAAELNQYVRDNLKAIGDPWQAYTPTWSASGTAPALGNGALLGRYMQAGKLVHFRITLTMGATTTYGTGQWRFTLPVAPASSARQSFVLDCLDTGAASWTGSAAWISSLSALACSAPATTAGAADRTVGPTVPFTWGSGDQLTIVGTYEAA